MSFSSDVKAELCRVPVSKRCCTCAEAYGVLLYANTFSASEIKIVTGSPDFSRRLPKLFKRAFGVSFDAEPNDLRSVKQIFLINDKSKISSIFRIFGYEAEKSLAHHINFVVLEEDCCKAAFIRGAFLAGGSITNPSKRYHLELVTDHYSVSRETLSIMLEMGFSPKGTSRGGNYITYFKQSESIEDLFTTIGAPVSALEIMSTKVEKDMRNTINRKVNCDSANADKVVNAAQEQLDAIRRIDRTLGLNNLPERLQETAFLRIANPEASISDLAILADPPVSKSCLSHRLRKLVEKSK